jgi:hemoglobin
LSTIYDEIGSETFEQLVSHFYALVSINPTIAPMYPKDDIHGAALRLKMFLEQYWGGPTTYTEERGHPRLRMRHAEFHIDSKARDAWLVCMKDAVNGLEISDDLKAELWNYMELAANSMVNQPD